MGLHQLRSNIIKGEIQNRFNLISKERVKIFEQNSETWWKLVEN